MRTKFVQLFSGETVQTVFKLAYLWLVLLSFNSFFAETALLSYCSYALALFGAPIVLARVIDFKAYWRMPLIGLMCLFLISFLISAISTAKYGITSNVQGFAWMTFEFFILFAHSARESVRYAYAELEKIAKSTYWYALVCSCLGLVMCVVGFVDSVVVAKGVVNYFGVHQGRLWGVYSDPNIGAVVCVLSALFGVWLYGRKKISVELLLVGVVAQLGYIALSGSRGALLCVAVSSFVVVGLFCWKKFTVEHSAVRAFKAIGFALCGCAVAVACVFSVGGLLQKCSGMVQASTGYVQPTGVISALYSSTDEAHAPEEDGASAQMEDVARSVQNVGESQNDDPASLVSDAASINSVDVESRFVVQDDLSGFSAGRLSIWKSAIDVFKSSPLVGVSHRNILAYAQSALPNTFIARADYTTMHNILFDVLVSQGIVGCGLFALMAAFGLKAITSFLRRTKDEVVQNAVIVGILAAICVAAMFYTEILYINSPSSIVFWITLGTVCHITRSDVVSRIQHDGPEGEGAKQ